MERDYRGSPVRLFLFPCALRMDNLTALRAAKAVFGRRKRMMRALFPSRAAFDALPPLPPAATVTLRPTAEPPEDDGEELDAREVREWLVELMNAFRGAGAAPWFCLPLAEDVEHVPLQ